MADAAAEALDFCKPVDGADGLSLLPETLQRCAELPPCGHFVVAQHESDCARFLADAKKLARCRAEAGHGRPLVSL